MRVLIVNVNWIGDVIFSTPAIHALRRRHPEAYLASLVVPRSAELLRLDPDLDEVIVFDEEGRHRGWGGQGRLIRELRAKRFDAAILLHRSFTRTLLVWFAGIRQRVGYATWKRRWLLTRAVPPPPVMRHRVEQFAALVEALLGETIPPSELRYHVDVPGALRHAVTETLQRAGVSNGDRYVVLHPGSNREEKRWPVDRYAELGRRLVTECGVRVLVTGTERDRPLGGAIRARCGSGAIDLCGRLTLGELAAVLGGASAVVTNDTGPLHVAISQGAKVIALFGPTWLELTGPYGTGEHHVFQRGRDLRAIAVDEVWACAKQLLSSG